MMCIYINNQYPILLRKPSLAQKLLHRNADVVIDTEPLGRTFACVMVSAGQIPAIVTLQRQGRGLQGPGNRLSHGLKYSPVNHRKGKQWYIGNLQRLQYETFAAQ